MSRAPPKLFLEKRSKFANNLRYFDSEQKRAIHLVGAAFQCFPPKASLKYPTGKSLNLETSPQTFPQPCFNPPEVTYLSSDQVFSIWRKCNRGDGLPVSVEDVRLFVAPRVEQHRHASGVVGREDSNKINTNIHLVGDLKHFPS